MAAVVLQRELGAVDEGVVVAQVLLNDALDVLVLGAQRLGGVGVFLDYVFEELVSQPSWKCSTSARSRCRPGP